MMGVGIGGYDSSKKAMLAMIERLYDEIETDKATVVECSIDMGRQEVTTVGSQWAQYIPTGRQTVNMVIQRNA